MELSTNASNPVRGVLRKRVSPNVARIIDEQFMVSAEEMKQRQKKLMRELRMVYYQMVSAREEFPSPDSFTHVEWLLNYIFAERNKKTIQLFENMKAEMIKHDKWLYANWLQCQTDPLYMFARLPCVDMFNSEFLGADNTVCECVYHSMCGDLSDLSNCGCDRDDECDCGSDDDCDN